MYFQELPQQKRVLAFHGMGRMSYKGKGETRRVSDVDGIRVSLKLSRRSVVY